MIKKIKNHAKQRKNGRKHDPKDLENKGNWKKEPFVGWGKNV